MTVMAGLSIKYYGQTFCLEVSGVVDRFLGAGRSRYSAKAVNLFASQTVRAVSLPGSVSKGQLGKPSFGFSAFEFVLWRKSGSFGPILIFFPEKAGRTLQQNSGEVAARCLRARAAKKAPAKEKLGRRVG